MGGLTGVPDPRYSNPELFDLNNPDAPIPQFVNALSDANVSITPEQVIEGLTYRAIEVPRRESREVVILYHYHHPDTPYATAFIATQNEKWEWKWRSINLKDSVTLGKFALGTSFFASDGAYNILGYRKRQENLA